MGIFEELLEKKGDIIVKLLDIIEGREVKTKMELSGVELKFGKTDIKLDGEIIFTLARKPK